MCVSSTKYEYVLSKLDMLSNLLRSRTTFNREGIQCIKCDVLRRYILLSIHNAQWGFSVLVFGSRVSKCIRFPIFFVPPKILLGEWGGERNLFSDQTKNDSRFEYSHKRTKLFLCRKRPYVIYWKQFLPLLFEKN